MDTNRAETNQPKKLKVGSLRVEIHPSGQAAGEAAANAVAGRLRQLEMTPHDIAIIFATGMSQLVTLHRLTSMQDLFWDQILGFHLDEYVGLDANHPASFRRYLRENLTSRVAMRKFFEIDGSSPDPQSVCNEYAKKLQRARPQLCLLGVGDNGHLAFNDPEEADFHDPVDVKIVYLDAITRQQQVIDGWFKAPEDVPSQAITVTIPALFRVPRLIVIITGQRKTNILRRMMEEPISPECPATILRSHPDATAYLDADAAAEWLDGNDQLNS